MLEIPFSLIQFFSFFLSFFITKCLFMTSQVVHTREAVNICRNSLLSRFTSYLEISFQGTHTDLQTFIFSGYFLWCWACARVKEKRKKAFIGADNKKRIMFYGSLLSMFTDTCVWTDVISIALLFTSHTSEDWK